MVILYPFYTWGNRGLETYHFYSIGNNERTENEHMSVRLQNLCFNHNADHTYWAFLFIYVSSL